MVLRDKEQVGNSKLYTHIAFCSCWSFLPHKGKRPLCGLMPASGPGQEGTRRWGEKKSGKLIESGFMRQLRLHACSSFYFTFFRVKIEVVLFSVGKHKEDALAFFSFNLFFFF